ncbi:MAG: hypothetical protein ACWA44_05365 [Thiotrichales bacterium]
MIDIRNFYKQTLVIFYRILNQPRVIWIVLLFIALFLALSLSSTQRWDGDGELYILNALNILSQETYSETNYKVNLDSAIHPAAYPPGLPLILAPVIDVFGISYPAIKLSLVICYIVMLTIVMKITEPFLETPWRLFILVALGLNPFIFGFKNYVFSEFPFMVFVYLALYTFDRMKISLESNAAFPRSFLWASVSGLSIAAAYETRSIGIVLFATVGSYTLFYLPRFRLYGFSVLLIGLASAVLITRLFPADVGTYASYFEFESIQDVVKIAYSIAHAGWSYLGALADLLGRSSYPITHWRNTLITIVAFAVIALAVVGFLIRLHKEITIYEIFAMIFMATLFVYPIYIEPQRYILPVFPLFIIYAVVAVTHAPRWYREFFRYRGVALVAAFVLLYSSQYFLGPRKPPVPSVDGQEAMTLYDQIKLRVAPDEVVFCTKPTIIALHAERPSTNWSWDPEPENLLEYAKEINAKWLVIIGPPIFSYVGDTLIDLLPQIDQHINLVWSSTHFSLYRIN